MRSALVLLAISFQLHITFLSFAQERVRAAVAANLLFAAQEFTHDFYLKTDTEIELISASTGMLTAQIINNAPYDIFFSADYKHAFKLYQEGKCSDPVVFTQGQLTIWTEKEISFENISSYIEELSERSLAIANPNLAPYGTAALKWLKENVVSDYDQLLVIAENVGQVNQYIYSGSVDMAFTALSASYSKALKGMGYWSPALDAPPIPHYACILTSSKNQTETWEFLEFILSERGQQILRKFGYLSTD